MSLSASGDAAVGAEPQIVRETAELPGEAGDDATPPLILLREVTKTYPGRNGTPVVALPPTTLELRPGMVVCVAGRSGSGKTTLLQVAAGLLAPSAGEIRWRGESLDGLGVDALTTRRARLMGFTFQAPSLIEALTVEENAALGGAVVRVADARDRARALLRDLGLEGLERRMPRELSGGEQQRVALARALFTGAPALVADEPTASLDRAAADVVVAVMVAAAREGTGVLLASHDPGVIAAAGLVVRLER
jgi:ABC-type lipoprotein export system ATPase subunit